MSIKKISEIRKGFKKSKIEGYFSAARAKKKITARHFNIERCSYLQKNGEAKYFKVKI